ncbi:hypothetical protein CDEST_05027 [Colletotrichum destructivum]|uniref:Uncharacterized protein n=1 Tax=Colletotrichum destructivum TaxID=34406 RepID=A0AAX4I9H9_9PEZI|nr:hypothetical protein CDEST_05027 [Colletotrichum destructivum]
MLCKDTASHQGIDTFDLPRFVVQHGGPTAICASLAGCKDIPVFKTSDGTLTLSPYSFFLIFPRLLPPDRMFAIICFGKGPSVEQCHLHIFIPFSRTGMLQWKPVELGRRCLSLAIVSNRRLSRIQRPCLRIPRGAVFVMGRQLCLSRCGASLHAATDNVVAPMRRARLREL